MTGGFPLQRASNAETVFDNVNMVYFKWDVQIAIIMRSIILESITGNIMHENYRCAINNDWWYCASVSILRSAFQIWEFIFLRLNACETIWFYTGDFYTGKKELVSFVPSNCSTEIMRMSYLCKCVQQNGNYCISFGAFSHSLLLIYKKIRITCFRQCMAYKTNYPEVTRNLWIRWQPYICKAIKYSMCRYNLNLETTRGPFN